MTDLEAWINAEIDKADRFDRPMVLAIALGAAARVGATPLREWLEIFTAHYAPWMDGWSDDTPCTVYSRHTFGQLRAARAALEGGVSRTDPSEESA